MLFQERESTAGGIRTKGVVWITGSTSLVRCAVQHLRSLSESEKRFAQYCRHRSHQIPRPCRTFATQLFPDLTTQTDVPDDAFKKRNHWLGSTSGIVTQVVRVWTVDAHCSEGVIGKIWCVMSQKKKEKQKKKEEKGKIKKVTKGKKGEKGENIQRWSRVCACFLAQLEPRQQCAR